MKTIKNRSLRKKTAATLSAVLAAALLVTGTFAWVTTSTALNEISQPGESDDPGGILHDDFDGEIDPGTGDYNKDVYVENTGNTNIYVRVKLEEIMNIGSDQRPSTPWVLHEPSTDDAGNLCHEDCEKVNQQDKYFHDYFTMGWGYDRANDTYNSKWYLPSSEASSENIKDDGNGTYIQDNTDYADMSQSDKEELGLKETPIGKIISMDAYMDLSASDRANYVGWIYDSNGWAYWSQPLESGNATSLLLDQVLINSDKLDELNKNGFYYAINVSMECVDKADLDAGWIGGTFGDGTVVDDVTGEAKEFLEGISGGGGTTPAVDKSGLEKAIMDADVLDTTGVIQKLIDDLDAAVAAGEGVLADGSATQDEVDAATDAIKDAIDAINKVLVVKSTTLDTNWATNDNFYCSFIWIDGSVQGIEINYDRESNGILTEEYAYGYIPLGDYLTNTDIENHPVTVNVKTEGIPQTSITVGWGVDLSLKNSYWCRDLTGVPCIILTYLPTRAELLECNWDSYNNRYMEVTFTLTQDGKTSEEITVRSTYTGAF